MDYLKNLIKVLRARLAIGQGLTGNHITTGPNHYRLTRTFLDGEALHIFDLKSTELRHETVANLIIVMNHFVTYFGPECLSKKKRYIRYKMEKPHNLATSQYVGLVCDINARMAQMPPLFDENQQLEESELVDSLANKAPRSHKDMLISQGLNPETRDLETFVEHCKRAEATDNISGARFAVSDEDSNTKRKKKGSKFKERDENSKERHKKQSSLYCSQRGENKIYTTR